MLQYVAQYARIDPATLAPPADSPQQQLPPQQQQPPPPQQQAQTQQTQQQQQQTQQQQQQTQRQTQQAQQQLQAPPPQQQPANGEAAPRGGSLEPLGYVDPLDAWRPLLAWFVHHFPHGRVVRRAVEGAAELATNGLRQPSYKRTAGPLRL